jgi:hypothetical protein
LETLRKYIPINFELIANPINWVIVVLMVVIAGLALAVIFPTNDISEGKNNGSR